MQSPCQKGSPLEAARFPLRLHIATNNKQGYYCTGGS